MTITSDEGAAEQRHGTLLEAANDDAAWEDAIAAPDRRRNRPAGESARRQRHRLRNRRLHQPFAPQTAYADETAGGPTIDTEDAADDDNDENLLSFTPGEPLENDGGPTCHPMISPPRTSNKTWPRWAQKTLPLKPTSRSRPSTC